MSVRSVGILSLVLSSLLAGGCAVQPRLNEPAGAQPAESASESPQAREVVVEALALLGVPYRYGGSDPATGFDCSGLVRHVVAKVAGLKLPADAKGMSAYGAKVDAGDMEPGDLVFFNTLHRPYSHVGIYIGGRRFVHAPSTGGVVEIVNMNRRYWMQRFDGARRLPL